MSGGDQFDKIPTLRSEIPNGNAYEHARVKGAKANVKKDNVNDDAITR